MRKILWSGACVIVLSTSLALAWALFRTESVDQPVADDRSPAVTQETYPVAGFFPIFSLNVHDWGNIDESIVAVGRALDIHERYQVPLDVYFTDPLFRLFVERAPELIGRLRASQVATVAYHTRPPAPYYPGYDSAGMSSLNDQELEETIMDYETHALDLSTGRPTDDPGGYAHVADVMGYAPVGVGIVGQGRVGLAAAHVYKKLGTTFVTAHGGEYELGQETPGGLLYRPEDIELKIYEQARRSQDGAAAIEKAIEGADASSSRVFVGIKYHDDNFYYAGGTPWWPVYFEGVQSDDGPRLASPYDISKGASGGRMQTAEETEQEWTLYESAVRYVSEHPDSFHPVNLRDLASMAKSIPL